MAKSILVVLLGCIASTLAADCSFSNIHNITCPTSESKAPSYCAGASLTDGTIIRCANGCPVANTCAQVLLSTPPEGPKTGALCWDEGDGGNAQCTFDCIQVTALNGTVFYPLGCKSLNDGGSGASVTAGTGTTSLFRPESSGGTTESSRSITLAPGPVVVSTSMESTSGAGTATTTTKASSTTGSGTGGAATATTSGNAAVCLRIGMMTMQQSAIGMAMMCLGMDYLWR